LRLVVPSACWNASKISFCLSLGMPMPVSVTSIAIACAAPRSTGWLVLHPEVAERTASVTLPSAVNLNALESRLSITCWSRFSSVRIVAGRLASNSTLKSRFLSAASWRKVRSICCLSPLIGKSPISIETVPEFDLRQVEDVVDQVEQVRARRVDRAREFGLLLVEVALRIVRQQLGEDQQRVERRAQLVAHVGEEFGTCIWR
jgi:hypothetical protein